MFMRYCRMLIVLRDKNEQFLIDTFWIFVDAVLAKAVHMLSKIGDEVYVVPQEESISFRTVNMAKSAYSDFTFHKNFFSYYTFGDLQEEDMQKCKISMRVRYILFF